MARIAFVTWEGGGNVGPAIGLAQALRDRGHQVRFFGYESQRQRLSARGFALHTLKRSGDLDVGRVDDGLLARLVRRVWACPEHIDDIADALAEAPADVLVVDFMMQGALVAAERMRVPTVAFVHSAVGGLLIAPDSPMAIERVATLNAMRAAAGVRSIDRLRDGWGKLLALVTTIAELDTAAAGAEPSWRYVGPIVEQFADGSPAVARERRAGVPLVLASFSTTGFWEQRGRIDNTLAALADEPVRVLVSGIDATEIVLPANAEAHRFVPHAEVLPAASAVVTHCGHGTLSAALAHGLPIVGLPNPAADQPYLARRMAELGAGVELAGDAPPELIREAVRRVLREPSYAEAARRLAASIAAAPGANGAAAEIERVAQQWPASA